MAIKLTTFLSPSRRSNGDPPKGRVLPAETMRATRSDGSGSNSASRPKTSPPKISPPKR
jgi:hypothetical protein